MSTTINLSVLSTLESVRLIGLAAKGVSSLIFDSSNECEFIETALVESCTNVVEHAYNFKPDKSINVDIEIEKNKNIFVITDQGKSFEPAKVKNFQLNPEDIKNLPEGGMGIFIVDKIMDEVNYVSNKGENKLKLVKYF